MKILGVAILGFILLGSSCLAYPITAFIQGEIISGVTLTQVQHDLAYSDLQAKMGGQEIDQVIIVLITPGGSVNESIAIYDYLISLKKSYKVITIASGICMSGGMIILQAGDERCVTEHTLLMTHAPLVVIPDKTPVTGTDAIKLARDLENTNKRLIKIFSERMRKDIRLLTKYFTDTMYFMEAQEAYQIGFVDKVIYDPTNYKN